MTDDLNTVLKNFASFMSQQNEINKFIKRGFEDTQGQIDDLKFNFKILKSTIVILVLVTSIYFYFHSSYLKIDGDATESMEEG